MMKWRDPPWFPMVIINLVPVIWFSESMVVSHFDYSKAEAIEPKAARLGFVLVWMRFGLLFPVSLV